MKTALSPLSVYINERAPYNVSHLRFRLRNHVGEIHVSLEKVEVAVGEKYVGCSYGRQ